MQIILICVQTSFPMIRFIVAAAVALVLTACGGGDSSGSSPTAGEPQLSDAADLGRQIFSDVSLSASGRMSCATCHDAAFGHASPFDGPVSPGGVNLELQGTRNSPSIRYLRFNTAFHFDDEGTPTGGFFLDGRASSLADQAKQPFVNAVEMANPDVATVIAKLAAAP